MLQHTCLPLPAGVLTLCLCLLQHDHRMVISFAPYSATFRAYKNLQDNIFNVYNTNVDFVIYQVDDGKYDTLQKQHDALVDAAKSKSQLIFYLLFHWHSHVLSRKAPLSC